MWIKSRGQIFIHIHKDYIQSELNPVREAIMVDNPLDAMCVAIEEEIRKQLPRVLAEYPHAPPELITVRARVRARNVVVTDLFEKETKDND
jgi:hypothetical protein